MAILVEMFCLCTRCRLLFRCCLPAYVGHMALPSLHAKWQPGLVLCKKSSLGITSYFLTLSHVKLNHKYWSSVINFFLVKCSAQGVLLLIAVRSRFLLSSATAVSRSSVAHLWMGLQCMTSRYAFPPKWFGNGAAIFYSNMFVPLDATRNNAIVASFH